MRHMQEKQGAHNGKNLLFFSPIFLFFFSYLNIYFDVLPQRKLTVNVFYYDIYGNMREMVADIMAMTP